MADDELHRAIDRLSWRLELMRIEANKRSDRRFWERVKLAHAARKLRDA